MSISSIVKPKKVLKKAIHSSSDPYQLSEDELEPPMVSFVKPSDSVATGSVVKKRKFFTTQGEGLARRSALSSFELLHKKLSVKVRLYRVAFWLGCCNLALLLCVWQSRSGCRSRVNLSKAPKSASRGTPMSEEERARIAATTIWLPIPRRDRQHEQLFATTSTPSRPQRLETLGEEEAEVSGILTGNPAVRPLILSASPNISRTGNASTAPLESTAGESKMWLPIPLVSGLVC